jgi:hypothetical protein
MDTPTTATESAFYADLTRLFCAMRDAPMAAVEAAVEQRLREFIGSQGGANARGLKITLTWNLPETDSDTAETTADEWTVQTTRYEILPRQALVPFRRPEARETIVQLPLPQAAFALSVGTGSS